VLIAQDAYIEHQLKEENDKIWTQKEYDLIYKTGYRQAIRDIAEKKVK
jgi:hypothetical protein